jgi:hypothetical protein
LRPFKSRSILYLLTMISFSYAIVLLSGLSLQAEPTTPTTPATPATAAPATIKDQVAAVGSAIGQQVGQQLGQSVGQALGIVTKNTTTVTKDLPANNTKPAVKGAKAAAQSLNALGLVGVLVGVVAILV